MNEENNKIPDENESEESFESLLDQHTVASVYLNPGDRVEAKVIKVTPEWVFIDLGGKSEGSIDVNEFMDDDENISVKEGDGIEAYFLSSRNNEMLFTTRLSEGATNDRYLETAFHNRIPVEGIVEKEIKGGFEVKLLGKTRSFCPYSQMGLHRVDDTAQYIGKNVIFKITEYAEKGRNIIISHRSILEEELRKKKEDLKGSLEEGMTVSVKVISIKDFGVFVDLEGLQGLIPVSEVSWGRVEDIHSVLSVGQEVEVVIKSLDWENDKFSFSLKECMPDPWDGASARYPEGSEHKGTVSRLVSYGAFITLESGMDGLIHISELGRGKRINHPREVLTEAQTVDVKIVSVDEEHKRLSLEPVSDDQDAKDDDDYKKHISTGGKSSSGSFGTLGDLLREKLEKK